MHRLRTLLLLLALGLAGCAAPAPQGAYRAAGAPIYSNAVFEPERMAGSWHEVAGFFDPAHQSCSLGLARASGPEAGAMRFDLEGCDGQGARSVVAAITGSGRFAPQGGADDWWILWVDSGYRSMVIGTPSGRFAAVLNRDGAMPEDRMRAAREILDWNGYDLARLVPRR